MNTLLALRLSRRAMAAVALDDDDQIVFADGRHLTSRMPQAEVSADRYLAHVIDQIRPRVIAAYVPDEVIGITALVLTKLQRLTETASLPLRIVKKTDLLR